MNNKTENFMNMPAKWDLDRTYGTEKWYRGKFILHTKWPVRDETGLKRVSGT